MSFRRSRAFTLIELLIVITIIAILAGLAFPAMETAMTGAKKTQAGAMIANLKTALTAFYTEYGYWPSSTQNASSDSQLLPTDAYLILAAKEGNADPQNTRQIPFLTFSARDVYPNPLPAGGRAKGLADPWSAALHNYTAQNYQIWIDTSYDNQVAVPAPWSQSLDTGVAIWDPGPPRSGQVNTNTNTMIKSW
ncbi:MAG: type II secretion system protein [Verrucomicrobium sp.]|nr:type II secretion system protein [Verrucomicrobium sp.]